MPEILDADLCQLVLTSAAWGALGREDLPWMTPPPASNWDQAVSLLKMLGALGSDGRLTPAGEAMSKLPMHPRLANMVLGSGRAERVEGVGVAALLAAIVEEGSRSRETDIRKIAEEVRETPNRPFSKRILQLARRFESLTIKQSKQFKQSNNLSEGSLLALAYPDRVAKNRGNGSFRMVSGRGAFVDQGDPLAKSPYVVCCELDDRAGDAKLFLGCPIDEREVEDLFGDRIVEEPCCEWDRQNERVKCVARRRLGGMAMKEVAVNAESQGRSDEVASCLVAGVRQKGVDNLPCWTRSRGSFGRGCALCAGRSARAGPTQATMSFLPRCLVLSVG